MILQIISGGLKIAGMLIGNALLAKWLGTFRLYMDKYADADLRKKTEDHYQVLNKEATDVINQRGPY